MASRQSHNFIQKAIKHPGALSHKAEQAGMSTMEYARAHIHDKGQTGNQARFFLNVLNRVRPGKKK